MEQSAKSRAQSVKVPRLSEAGWRELPALEQDCKAQE